ncbi:MAG: reverse transcriptase domain-containing protein [Cyanobacteria bacterium J06582_2]
MLSKGAIEEARHLRFQGRLFSVPKKDSTERRVILDLSHLNKHIQCDTFKMTTVSQVRTLLQPLDYTSSIDLTDAFWHVPIASHFRPWLGFALGRKRYRFKVLPFGLSIAPRIFTKLVSAALCHLRLQGIQIVAYLDDLLVWSHSKETCSEHVQVALEFLTSLGFHINHKKSRLQPSQVFEWLGVQWDLVRATISLPKDKQRSAFRQVQAFRNAPLVSRREQETLAGYLNFASLVDPLLKCRLKDVLRINRRYAFRSLRDKKWPCPIYLKNILKPWSRCTPFKKKVPLVPPPTSITIHTDASTTGWGGYISKSRQIQGQWSPLFQGFHINFLELYAVYLSLRKLRPRPHSHIHLVMDNMTGVSCVRRGGSRSPILNKILIKIFDLQIQKSWHFSVTHLAGVRNVIADSLSRDSTHEGEWTLSKSAFHQVQQEVPDLQVDLFASATNHQLPSYITLDLDPLAQGSDALQLDWNRWERIYLFPPPSILMKILPLLQTFKGTAALIAPLWPASPWFSGLMSLQPRLVRLLSPGLWQEVQRKICFDSSSLSRHLHIWIFSRDAMRESSLQRTLSL